MENCITSEEKDKSQRLTGVVLSLVNTISLRNSTQILLEDTEETYMPLSLDFNGLAWSRTSASG